MEKIQVEQIKILGQKIGNVIEKSSVEANDLYLLKKNIVDITRRFTYLRDRFSLKLELNKIDIDSELKNIISQTIQMLPKLDKELLDIYSVNVYIPDDEKFIENQNLIRSTNTLAALYGVPMGVVAMKIAEINKYDFDKKSGKNIS